MAKKSKVLLINGSGQFPSLNEKYLRLVDEALAGNAELVTEFIDLRARNLPLFIGWESVDRKKRDAWRHTVAEADGYVFACPEYYHAMPAMLKNAFEYLANTEMRDKPAFVFGATPTHSGTINAQHSLYGTLRTLGVWLLPDELFIPQADRILDGAGQITDPKIAARLTDLSTKFVQVVGLFADFRNQSA